ncbi:hypothetical protein UFOVP238_18 [uncultured Caudovirales phage]|uniref:Uncharacterized protein n=1 Tax=uncultured Caudovirales phage TaxID=2100421 RepID=A0A6J7WU00_9CAUD|nr:hypothetical protein UFOVP238_18 [uncultured Caudovirales phage]
MEVTSLQKILLPAGMGSLERCRDELSDYTDVLLGRKAPPFDSGVSTLMEFATAALGRALEMQARIQRAENDGGVSRGSRWYKFRTGELRTFIELANGAVELGSRRITVAKMDYDMRGSY